MQNSPNNSKNKNYIYTITQTPGNPQTNNTNSNTNQSTNINEIGNAINCTNLEYAEIMKYIILLNKTTHPSRTSEWWTNSISSAEPSIILSKWKFYFLRNTCLISIQYIYQLVQDFPSHDQSTFLYPPDRKFFGPTPNLVVSKNKTNIPIDTITLNLSKNEYIYQAKGQFNPVKNQITQLTIHTTFGQFINLGFASEQATSFKWDFYFNNSFFEGFIIGWDEKHINYLASITSYKERTEEKEELVDVTYTQPANLDYINPIIQSSIFGTFNNNDTIFNDPYMNSDILKLFLEKKIYISEISVYYNVHIEQVSLEYTFVGSNKKINVNYNTNNASYKKTSLKLQPDDAIKEMKVYYNNYIEGLVFNSWKGRKLHCLQAESWEEISVVEFKDKNFSSYYVLIGVVCGYNERVQCVQFYYEIINTDN